MPPASQEIARDEWQPFFDAFSGMHRGAVVTVEVRSNDEPELKAAAPLEEIAAEASERIAIVLRPTSEGEVSHVVESPERVWLRDADEDGAALEIESSAGTTTLLRVSGGALPRPEL